LTLNTIYLLFNDVDDLSNYSFLRSTCNQGLFLSPVTPPDGATAGTKVNFLLLNTLEGLGQGDPKKFQWCLIQGVEGFSSISKGQLEDADRLVTVDRMVESYCDEGAVKITLEILRMMGQNNLADELKEKLTKNV
uniref:Pyrin domain-containing protein n=1 Tax=Hucho hucho TaxID=62062 RepID=A0A4W5K9W7_9TELE